MKQSEVKLSQCMIVKNEETNIERALSWAKDIAFEQIVIDTGSTDRTVEIAKRMGAKVFHFEWVNDFSAAKNFAMDKANGDWIAILDADEYMLKDDAKELVKVLEKIQNNNKLSKEYEAISNSWVQLNDEGEPFSIITVQRIFRNLPFIRYIGKIHESIFIQNKAYNAENLHIMHTGYAQTEYERAGKRERNIRMLKTELKDDPYNPTAMIYLADSIKAASTEEAYKEAEDLYLKALTGKRQAESAIKRLAYDFLINRYLDNLSKINEAITLCDDAIKVLPNIIDYVYFRAVLQNKKGNFKDALIDLQQCEKAFTTGTNPPETRVLMPSQILLYHQLFISAIGLKDKQMEATTRAIIMALLTEAKNGSTTLGPYLVALVKENKNGAEIFESLSPVYNINNPQDLILITRAAKEYGIIGLAQLTLEMASRIINSKEC